MGDFFWCNAPRLAMASGLEQSGGDPLTEDSILQPCSGNEYASQTIEGVTHLRLCGRPQGISQFSKLIEAQKETAQRGIARNSAGTKPAGAKLLDNADEVQAVCAETTCRIAQRNPSRAIGWQWCEMTK